MYDPDKKRADATDIAVFSRTAVDTPLHFSVRLPRSSGERTNRMAKIGRNDPCHCGSGKKYKRCCLAKGVSVSGFTQDERKSAIEKLNRFV